MDLSTLVDKLNRNCEHRSDPDGCVWISDDFEIKGGNLICNNMVCHRPPECRGLPPLSTICDACKDTIQAYQTEYAEARDHITELKNDIGEIKTTLAEIYKLLALHLKSNI